MDLNAFFEYEYNEHETVVKATRDSLKDPFIKMVQICVEAVKNGHKIIFFGNGGSAADAQHLATELSIKYCKERDAIAALALTTDTSALTAAANDFGFEYIFSRQIEAIGKAGDVAIGISTSGNSQNVLTAFETARAMDLKVIGLSGKDGGKMPPLCDEILIVPSSTTARIQEMHITLGQMLCGALEIELGLIDAAESNENYRAFG